MIAYVIHNLLSGILIIGQLLILCIIGLYQENQGIRLEIRF